MNYNTQNAKIASITEKTLIVGIDVGSETHFVRAFDWRNYEFTKKPLAFSNTEAGFLTFKAWQNRCDSRNGANRTLLRAHMGHITSLLHARRRYWYKNATINRLTCKGNHNRDKRMPATP